MRIWKLKPQEAMVREIELRRAGWGCSLKLVVGRKVAWRCRCVELKRFKGPGG